MPSRYWIKLYIEILDDPKMGMLQPWLWQRAITFFLAAGEYNQEGLLPPVEQLAWRLRITNTDLVKSLGALSEVGITVETPDGWLVKNFTKRQEPSTAERVRQYREHKHKEEYYGNKNGNKPVTNRYTDTDTESDTDEDNGAKTAPSPPSDLPPEQTKPKKRRRSGDPRTELPAIQAIFSILGKYPKADEYDVLIEVIGEHPDMPRLRKCWAEWRRPRPPKFPKGYSAYNYGWITDWYVNGIPSQVNPILDGSTYVGK